MLRCGTAADFLEIINCLFVHCARSVLCVCVQSNNFVEGVSHKIRRQIDDLERVSGAVTSSLTVDGVPVDSYLTRFVRLETVKTVICF